MREASLAMQMVSQWTLVGETQNHNKTNLSKEHIIFMNPAISRSMCQKKIRMQMKMIVQKKKWLKIINMLMSQLVVDTRLWSWKSRPHPKSVGSIKRYLISHPLKLDVGISHYIWSYVVEYINIQMGS